MFGKQNPSKVMFIALIGILLFAAALQLARTPIRAGAEMVAQKSEGVWAERAAEVQGSREAEKHSNLSSQPHIQTQSYTVTYIYDDAGRLVEVDYGEGYSIGYTYDNAGNLLSRTVTGPTPTATPTKSPTPTATPTPTPTPTEMVRVYLPMLLKSH